MGGLNNLLVVVVYAVLCMNMVIHIVSDMQERIREEGLVGSSNQERHRDHY